MTTELQQIIEDNKDTSSLFFSDKSDNLIRGKSIPIVSITKEELENLPLDNLVYKCVFLTNDYYSINSETNEIETNPRKWRSSLDIWRHVKYFKPEINLVEVMDSLYKNRGNYVGQFCGNISKRVFKSAEIPECVINSYGLLYQNRIDEYNLIFNQWRKI
jgi:hypothetical protein